MNFATAYLSQQSAATEKWKSLDLSHFAKLSNLDQPTQLIPFSGMPFFEKLTESQKKQLYFGFVQMVCEALIVFEQMLLKTVHCFPELDRRDPRFGALRVFAREEFFHLRAYRKYLDNNQTGPWPLSLISRQTRWLKNFYALLLSIEPLCIFFPGAKSEIYSIQYTRFLGQCPEISKSDWAHLNRMHSADEVHHVGFDFELMNSFLHEASPVRKVRIIFATYLMSLAIQLIPIIAGIRLINSVFGAEKRRFRLKLVFLFFRWSVLIFTPYSLTKIQLKKLFEKYEIPTAFWLRFLTW